MSDDEQASPHDDAAAGPSLVGTVLDGCRIERRLGSGAMGEVYFGHEEFADRPVAVKTIRDEIAQLGEEMLQRFRNEVRAIAKIHSQHVVRMYSAGELPGGGLYVKMEFVDGFDLARYQRDQDTAAPDLNQLVRWLRDAARGLHDAELVDVVHRDVKPANLLVRSNGDLVVADFGIAAFGDVQTRMTAPGAMFGTLRYASPEQCEGERVDARSDIYSLGATFYELLTGQSPVSGDSLPALLASKRRQKELSILREGGGALAGSGAGLRALDALIRSMTRVKPGDRPASFGEVLAALEPILELDLRGDIDDLPATVVGPAGAPSTAAKPLVGGSRGRKGLAMLALLATAVALGVTRPWESRGTQPVDPPAKPGPNPGPHPGPNPGKDGGGGGTPPITIPADKIGVLPDGDSGDREEPGGRDSSDSGGAPSLEPGSLTRFLAWDQGDKNYVRRIDNVGVQMVWIEGGQHTLGDEKKETGPWGTVGIHALVSLSSGYWVSTTEVTQRVYLLVMNEAPWRGVPGAVEDRDRPACNVTWHEAVAFCERLTELERAKGSGGLPSDWAYRLPTEAEWEIACRAGSRETFCFGSDAAQLRDYAVYGENGKRLFPAPVATRQPNAAGLYDMHGNVREWCADQVTFALTQGIKNFAFETRAIVYLDPVGRVGDNRLLRGGAFSVSAAQCRSSGRWTVRPDERQPHHGFRVVVAPVREAK